MVKIYYLASLALPHLLKSLVEQFYFEIISKLIELIIFCINITLLIKILVQTYKTVPPSIENCPEKVEIYFKEM